MIFLIGFLLGMTGLGMLIAGEVPWFGGRKVPAPTSRRVGTILVLFFPAMLLVRLIVAQFEPHFDINVTVINWTVTVLWVVGALVVLVRGLPAGPGRRTAPVAGTQPVGSPFDVQPSSNPFESEPGPAPVPPKAAPAKIAKPAPQQKNPFDFG